DCNAVIKVEIQHGYRVLEGHCVAIDVTPGKTGTDGGLVEPQGAWTSRGGGDRDRGGPSRGWGGCIGNDRTITCVDGVVPVEVTHRDGAWESTPGSVRSPFGVTRGTRVIGKTEVTRCGE